MADIKENISVDSITSFVQTLSPWELALIGAVLVSWVALTLSLLAIRRIQKQNASVHHILSQLNRDLRIASNGAIGMGQRIIGLERKLAEIKGEDISAVVESNPGNSTKTLFEIGDLDSLPRQSTAKSTAPTDNAKPNETSLTVPPGLAKQKVSLKVKPQLTQITPPPINKPKPHLAAIDKTPAAPNYESPTAKKVKENTRVEKLTPFELAEKLFDQGLEADEVASRCGLSSSEAALMQLVKRQRAAVAAS